MSDVPSYDCLPFSWTWVWAKLSNDSFFFEMHSLQLSSFPWVVVQYMEVLRGRTCTCGRVRACKLTNWLQPELMCVAGRGHFFKRLWILKIIFLAEDKLAGLAVIYVVRGGQWMGETECNRGGGCASLPLSIQEIYAALPAEPWYAPSPLVFSWSISPGLQSCPNIFMLELQNLPLQESLHSLTRQLTHLSTHHRSCLFVGLSSPL